MPSRLEQSEPAIRKVFNKLNLSFRKQFQLLIKQPWRELQKQIELYARSLKQENGQLAVDSISEQLLSNTSFVLAAYRILTPLANDRDRILVCLQKVMGSLISENIEGYLMSRIGITQEEPQKAFDTACKNFKKKGEEQMGRSFIYEQEVAQRSLCVVNIRKCFFNDFFKTNCSAEITTVYCAGDNIWMEELNKPKYFVSVERTKTLAEGKDACDFRFSKVRKS